MWNRLRFLNGTCFSSEVVPAWRSTQHGKALVQGCFWGSDFICGLTGLRRDSGKREGSL